MKTMTCRQLGGACDMEFHASTFEAIATQSKQHGLEMYEKGDGAHLRALNIMKARMSSPGAMNIWFEAKRKEFDALPDEESMDTSTPDGAYRPD